MSATKALSAGVFHSVADGSRWQEMSHECRKIAERSAIGAASGFVLDGPLPCPRRYHSAMIDDELVIPFDLPDADLSYRHYLRTCEMLGAEPILRGRALGLI